MSDQHFQDGPLLGPWELVFWVWRYEEEKLSRDLRLRVGAKGRAEERVLQAMGMGTGGIRPNRKSTAQGEDGWRATAQRVSGGRLVRSAGPGQAALTVSKHSAHPDCENKHPFNHLDQLFTVCTPGRLCHLLPHQCPGEVGFHRLCQLHWFPWPGYMGGERVESLFLFTACLVS